MGDTAAMTSSQASSLMDASMATSSISAFAGGFENAAAIKAQGTYASSIARTNASMANLKASQVLQAGDVVAGRKALETKGAIGAVRAVAGASGVDVNKGSPAIAQSEIGTTGGIDVATIKNNAARAAWGYQTQGIQDTFQAQFETLTAKTKAEQSLVTGGLAAISAPLSMYSQAALWQYRYGGRGVSGVPFPSSAPPNTGGTVSTPSEQDDSFWGTS